MKLKAELMWLLCILTQTHQNETKDDDATNVSQEMPSTEEMMKSVEPTLSKACEKENEDCRKCCFDELLAIQMEMYNLSQQESTTRHPLWGKHQSDPVKWCREDMAGRVIAKCKDTKLKNEGKDFLAECGEIPSE